MSEWCDMLVLAELRRRFAAVLSKWTTEPEQTALMLLPAQDPKFGDYQANFAMPLAKAAKTNPRELAAQIIASVDLSDLCDTPEIAGPGFINLRLKDDWLTSRINAIVTDTREGVAPVERPRTYVIDFSGPNVAKPMHVGHLRSTVIGDALYRLLKFLGHTVIGDNHVGDWGTQFGMILFGYKNFLDPGHLQQDFVGELARLYRLVNQLSDYHDTRAKLPKLDQALADKLAQLDQAAAAKDDKAAQKARKKLVEDVEGLREEIGSSRKKLAAVESSPQLSQYAEQYPEIAVQARQETAKLHAGDEENTRLWQQFVPACLQAIQGVYDRLQVKFDHTLGESFYNPQLADVVADLRKRGLATESQGAQCVFIPGNEAPFIIQKSDGAYTYATTDLATIRYRKEQLHADAMLYVVDSRQSEHFKLLFETARLWGYQDVEFQHVSFGSILGEDGRPFKTRSGDTVGLESLLNEAIEEARKVIESASFSEEEQARLQNDEAKQQVAEAVGLGGIKYIDLKHNRESDYVFSWSKMLAKTGDTATYMQYAFARVCGIMRKLNIDRDALRTVGGRIQLSHPKERALALQLVRFPDILSAAAAEYRPNFLTEYLFQTANGFSSFYDNCSVANAETPELQQSRLQLCDLTARILERGLSLLGIQTIEQM